MTTDKDIEELIETLRFKASADSLICFKKEEQKPIEREYRMMLSYAENVMDAYRVIERSDYYPHLWDKLKSALETCARKKPANKLRHKDLKVIADDWLNTQDKLGRFLAWAWRKDQDRKEYERMMEKQVESHGKEIALCQ